MSRTSLCDACDASSGYIQVGPRYVDEVAPWTPPPYPSPQSDAEVAVNASIAEADRRRRAAVENSVYPCPRCNPEQYDLWLVGDWPVKQKATRPTPVPDPTPPVPSLPYRDGDF